MVTVTASELRRHFHKLLKVVQAGQTVVVTKYGKAHVALKPFEEIRIKKRAYPR
jgi:prevent-host-death family protein